MSVHRSGFHFCAELWSGPSWSRGPFLRRNPLVMGLRLLVGDSAVYEEDRHSV